ncbi:DNA-binding protein [Noviherbaspirillum sp. CPCC 100848]|uniref:DNA-binding protein n=1 Tax=Noviherbaspirillum album TaxID=3080276 RepID=A0ABU6J3H4_9BURK|nr:DNA-binding protein [Noviherbaspirillum sp. CPCC 100848]MEC4718063.1 DNA-binding protein [Noviherbaspirillum sp. CPCC 100848]
MARSGIYKIDVKRARDALLAQRVHPSVDAVRIALGNTGSKTTIHKYLKELEDEDGGPKEIGATISEALQDLVGRLATQLQEEATLQINTVRAEQETMERRHAEALAAAQQEAEQWQARAQRLEQSLADEQATNAHTRETLQRETVLRHTAEQHAVDLKERLAENDLHLQSLEDKHRHAREALEHYRQSTKEQREQEQRRHEHQVHQLQAELRLAQQAVVVKQEEVTRLNQDGVRLVSDLSHAQKGLYDTQAQIRQLEQKVESLQGVEQRAAMLAAQLQDRDQQIKSVMERLTAATALSDTLAARHRELELELVITQAKLDTQRVIADELRQYVMKDAQTSLVTTNPQSSPD